MKNLFMCSVLLISGLLTACNTVQGIGRDTQSGGQKMSRESTSHTGQGFGQDMKASGKVITRAAGG